MDEELTGSDVVLVVGILGYGGLIMLELRE